MTTTEEKRSWGLVVFTVCCTAVIGEQSPEPLTPRESVAREGLYALLEHTVEALHEAVGLRMIRCRSHVSDVTLSQVRFK